MENASKALIMAGGIFIAIIILAIGVNLFISYRNVAERYDQKLTLHEIAGINKDFEKYLASDKNGKITIQEAVTAVRAARDYNEKYGENTIKVFISGARFDEKNNADFAEKIKSIMKSSTDKKYTINISSYYGTRDSYPGLVKVVNFN